MAHPKHAELRERYAFRCGYCGVSEIDSGGELTVDHYYPVGKGGTEGSENLVYACFRCNIYKSDNLPFAVNDDGETIKHILHPLRDMVRRHIGENDDGSLFGLTATGESHITILDLNREALIQQRRRKPFFARLNQSAATDEVAELYKVLVSQEEYITTLEALLRYYRSGVEPNG